MKTNFYLFKLTLALVLVGFMIGCGGNTGPKLKSENNSSPDDGKAATDMANKPKATKFTPDMVKAAWEKFDPEGKLGQDPKPAQLEALADKLNENISDGKIDFEGLKVDEITVEALAKGYEAKLKATIEGVLNPEPIPTEEPAEKFTPAMVKAAWEAATENVPEIPKKHRNRVLEDEKYFGEMTEKLNEHISDGKIDFQGLKIDAITVEALTKAIAATLPAAKKKADVYKSTNNAKQLFQGLTIYSDSDEGKLPVADKWCDAILQEVGTLAVFLSPQHPDTAKLKAALPNGGALKEPQPNDDAISPPKDDGGTAPAPKETAKRKPLQKEERISHYAFNKVMAGKIPGIGTSHETVLVFECELGWNGAGGLEDALKYMDKFKLERIAVTTADGAARAVTREELKKLKWEIAP